MANARTKLRTAIAISKDTGVRPIELCNLELKHIDLHNGIIYPETAKHGTPRALKLKESTLNILNKYLSKKHLNGTDKIFENWNAERYGKLFRHTRNRTAEKLQDPSIKTIRLYDLRHYFATMTYHKTKDILFTKQQMGHRRIETTLIYTQLLQFEKDDNYTCKVAQDEKQATELIESGFEYVTTTPNNLMLFRKRK